MTATEPLIHPDGRYSISETCKALRISRESLRKYTNAGQLRCGFRRTTGRKFYLGSEITRFWKAQS